MYQKSSLIDKKLIIYKLNEINFKNTFLCPFKFSFYNESFFLDFRNRNAEQIG